MSNLKPLLTDLITRIEAQEAEKKDISAQISLVYAEAKVHGLNVKVMRKIVAMRKMDPGDREELETLIDTYKSALGME